MSGEKLILLTGETGTGKTLCVQKLLADLKRDPRFCSVTIPYASLPFDEMLGYICADLQLNYGLGENDNKLQTLEKFLNNVDSVVHSVVIVIDEAQNMAAEIFDEFNNLLDLANKTKRNIQVVLAANHESDLRFHQPHAAAFSQKISHRCQLKPLTLDETASYIKFQLNNVGSNNSGLFTDGAAERIYEITQGRALSINVLCNHVLVYAANEQINEITFTHVNTAHRQQKFDDTLETHTSSISEAIARAAGEPGPIVEPELINRPESIISKTVTPPLVQPEIQAEIQEIPVSSVEEAPTQQSNYERPLPEENSNKKFWKIAIISLAALSISGFIFYQSQQQQISDLKQQVSNLKENTHTSEPVVISDSEVKLPPHEEKQYLEITEQKIEIEKIDLRYEPSLDQKTVSLSNLDQHAPDENIPNPPLSETKTEEPKNTVVERGKSITAPTPDPIPVPIPEENSSIATNQTVTEASQMSEVDQLLNLAEFQTSELRLTAPEGNNALETYRQILEIDPENLPATEGITSLKKMFFTWAKNNITKNKLERAKSYYQKILLIDPDDLEVPQMLTELEDKIAVRESSAIKSGLLGLAQEGNASDIKTLLSKGAFPDIQDQKGNSPLILATNRGYLDVVIVLLENGADPNIKNKDGDTALINASWNNQMKIVDQLLQNYADSNAANNRGWTSLMYASLHGHADLFMKLIKNGVDLESRTDDQKTPLSIAAHNGQYKMVSLLLQNGAQAKTEDEDGWSPLMHAISNNHNSITQILLLNDSDIDHQNSEGWTPLMLAAWNGYESIVEILLKNSADKSITNNDGNLAFDLAAEQQHFSIVSRL